MLKNLSKQLRRNLQSGNDFKDRTGYCASQVIPMRSLEPSIKKIWTIKFALFTGVTTVGSFVLEVIRFLGNQPPVLFVPVLLTGLIFIAGLSITLFIPRLQYRFWKFDLRTEELYLERGVLNRIRTIVPLRRIQHLDVSQNILEREFNLSKLIVHTAGSRSSDVVLPGLRMEEAEQLRDDVKRYILEDAV